MTGFEEVKREVETVEAVISVFMPTTESRKEIIIALLQDLKNRAMFQINYNPYQGTFCEGIVKIVWSNKLKYFIPLITFHQRHQTRPIPRPGK